MDYDADTREGTIQPAFCPAARMRRTNVLLQAKPRHRVLKFRRVEPPCGRGTHKKGHDLRRVLSCGAARQIRTADLILTNSPLYFLCTSHSCCQAPPNPLQRKGLGGAYLLFFPSPFCVVFYPFSPFVGCFVGSGANRTIRTRGYVLDRRREGTPKAIHLGWP